jgi:hypothetical protein
MCHGLVCRGWRKESLQILEEGGRKLAKEDQMKITINVRGEKVHEVKNERQKKGRYGRNEGMTMEPSVRQFWDWLPTYVLVIRPESYLKDVGIYERASDVCNCQLL